jgi:hypothetical protein
MQDSGSKEEHMVTRQSRFLLHSNFVKLPLTDCTDICREIRTVVEESLVTNHTQINTVTCYVIEVNGASCLARRNNKEINKQ